MVEHGRRSRSCTAGSELAFKHRVLKTASLSWSELTRRTWREVVDDHVFALAAQLSYCFFLALFSAILFLLALASFFPLSNAHTASVAWQIATVATQRPLIPLRQRLVPIASCLTVGAAEPLPRSLDG